MPTCVANGCINSVSKNAANNVTFHRFPFHNPSLLTKWVNAVGRDNWNPTKQSCLCSDHFTPKDYLRSSSGNLKENAVPSKFKRLMTTRLKKIDPTNDKPSADKFKAKRQSGQREVIMFANDQKWKKGNRRERTSSTAKRKLDDLLPEPEVSLPAQCETTGVWGTKMQASQESDESHSVTKPKSNKLMTSSRGNKPTANKSGEQSVTKSGESQAVTNSTGSNSTPSKPKRGRYRKILKTSSDESDDDVQVCLLGWKEKDSDIQLDANEVLAAVRVELDDNELSDDEQPEVIFEKWMKNRKERELINSNFPVAYTDFPSSTKFAIKEQQFNSCSIPADMDHIVAVNERRTRYRYIYRVGQCFPEEDDDIPFIKSKLTFVTKALQSQNEKLQVLQKKHRELSRSTTTLRDILGMPSTDSADELIESEEQEQLQPAYLIIGSHPSSSASLPSYRFTLTDCSPTIITQSTVQ